jgi:hypothetical protein
MKSHFTDLHEKSLFMNLKTGYNNNRGHLLNGERRHGQHTTSLFYNLSYFIVNKGESKPHRGKERGCACALVAPWLLLPGSMVTRE